VCSVLRRLAVLQDTIEQLLRAEMDEFTDRLPERFVGKGLPRDPFGDLVDYHANRANEGLPDALVNDPFFL
jgi:hypothetical protein